MKYGCNKNQKLYEAKIIEISSSGGGAASAQTYLVHYNGWNNRYDEWVGKERIQSVVEVPPPGGRAITKTPQTKTKVRGRAVWYFCYCLYSILYF